MTVTVVTNCSRCSAVFEQPRKQGRPRTLCDGCAGPKASTAAAKPIALGLKADPPKRADGRCAVCPKKIVVTQAARKYAGQQLDTDPFCSTECARKFHGTQLKVTVTDAQAEASTESGRLMSERLKAERGWDDGVEDAAA